MKIRGYIGTLSKDELQTQIRFEEAGALELFDCIVTTDKNNHPINVCKFKELPAGTIPDDIFLVNKDDSPPAGTSRKVLTDVLIINDHFNTLDFYR